MLSGLLMEQDEAQSISVERLARSQDRGTHNTPPPKQLRLGPTGNEIDHTSIYRSPAPETMIAASHDQIPDQDEVAPLVPETIPHNRADIMKSPKHQNSKAGSSEKQERPPQILRYRKRAICLLVIYLPFLIVPWVLTCVLAIRPLGKPSYISQSGQLSPIDFRKTSEWIRFTRIMGAVAGVLTIPITSALLAQAAVVYMERKNKSQKLSIKQLFVLADRDWNNLAILWKIIRLNTEGSSTVFLWFAAALSLLSAIQAPIQQALISYEPRTVMTCLDLPYYSCSLGDNFTIQGYDPEPGDLSLMPQNVLIQDLRAQLTTFTEYTALPMLWPEDPVARDPLEKEFLDANFRTNRQTFWLYFNGLPDRLHPAFFVTALPNGITTGVLRQHAMRMNSSVTCEYIARSEYPSSCTGDQPTESSYNSLGNIEIRICAPGQSGVFPWALNRNRQDMSEDLFMDVYIPYRTILPYSVDNFTLHCQAGTTRGYFELGNWRNDYIYGPLLEQWPDLEEASTEWNDYRNVLYDYVPALENDTTYYLEHSEPIPWPVPQDPFETGDARVSGPLMSTAIALFGNGSFFSQAADSANSNSSAFKQICQQNEIPFGQLTVKDSSLAGYCYGAAERDDDSLQLRADIDELVGSWILRFDDLNQTRALLEASIFFANQAFLTKTADATWVRGAREIFTSPGMTIVKPFKTLAGTVAVSVLIFIQLLGLLYTVWYSYQVPTWVAALDAIAIAQIGAALTATNISSIGPLSKKDRERLTRLSGLVGSVPLDENTLGTNEGNVSGRNLKESAQVSTRSQNRVSDEGETRNNKGSRLQMHFDDGSTSLGKGMIRLGLDAPGLITRDMASVPWRRKWKRKVIQGSWV